MIATYGDEHWRELALTRAYPSVIDQGAHEIIVGHDPEGSIASVRNELASKATGEWLCFCDADDELAPGYLKAMQKAQADRALLTPIVQQVLRGRRKRPAFYPEVNLASGNWLIVGTVLQKSLFDEVGGFDEQPHGFEDFSLWSKCARVGAQVMKVRGAIYIQHINPLSKHRQGWRDRKWQVETHLRVVRELDEWERQHVARRSA